MQGEIFQRIEKMPDFFFRFRACFQKSSTLSVFQESKAPYASKLFKKTRSLSETFPLYDHCRKGGFFDMMTKIMRLGCRMKAPTSKKKRAAVSSSDNLPSPPSSSSKQKDKIPIALWIGIFFLTAAYTALALCRHWLLASDQDLATPLQALWKLARFQVPATTTEHFPNILGNHLELAFFLLVPLHRLFPGPEMLLVIQALAVGAATPLIFRFAARRLSRTAAALFSISFLLHWGIGIALQYDFHFIVLAVPVLAFALNALDEKRYKALSIALVLLLLIRENLGLVVCAFGMLLFVQQRRKWGLFWIVAGFSWTILALKWWIPALRGGSSYNYWGIFQHLGSGPIEASLYLLTHPWKLFTCLWDSPVKRETLRNLLTPFLGLPLASPFLLPTLPLWWERFLSASPFYWKSHLHYNAATVSILAFAAADGMRRLARFFPTHSSKQRLFLFFSLLIFTLAVADIPRTPLRILFQPAIFKAAWEQRTENQRIFSRLPDEASVSAPVFLSAHLARRKEIYLLHPGEPLGDYVIYYRKLVNPFPFPSEEKRWTFVQQAVSKTHRLIYHQGDWFIWRRISKPKENHADGAGR